MMKPPFVIQGAITLIILSQKNKKARNKSIKYHTLHFTSNILQFSYSYATID